MNEGDFSSLNTYRQKIGYDTPLQFDGSLIIENSPSDRKLDLSNITFDSLYILGDFPDGYTIKGANVTNILHVDAPNVHFKSTQADRIIIDKGHENITFDDLQANEFKSDSPVSISNSKIGHLSLVRVEIDGFQFTNSTATTIDVSKSTIGHTNFANSHVENMTWALGTKFKATDFSGFSSQAVMLIEAELDEASIATNPALGEKAYNANVEIDNGEITVPLDNIETPNALMTALLKENQGIFVGDRHSSVEIRDYLSGAMPILQSSGLETIYIEFITHYNQDMIDDYMANVPGSEEALYNHFTKNWYGEEAGGQGILSVLEAAKNNGIRVIGIDDLSFDTNNNIPDHLYLQQTFPTKRNGAWVSNILKDRENHDNGKYLVWGGSKHGDGRMDRKGIDLALGIPEVRMETLKNIAADQISVSPDPSADYVVSFAPIQSP